LRGEIVNRRKFCKNLGIVAGAVVITSKFDFMLQEPKFRNLTQDEKDKLIIKALQTRQGKAKLSIAMQKITTENKGLTATQVVNQILS
jgi:hypothetical protein